VLPILEFENHKQQIIWAANNSKRKLIKGRLEVSEGLAKKTLG